MKAIYLTYFYLLFAIASFAQFNAGTLTILRRAPQTGYIKLESDSSIVFKKDNGPSQRFTAIQIESLKMGTTLIKPLVINGRTQFLKVPFEAQGMALYFPAYSQTPAIGYVQSSKSGLIRLTPDNYIIELRKLLLDSKDASLIQRINKSLSFESRAIANLLEQYAHAQKVTVLQKTGFNGISLGIGLTSGISMNRFDEWSYRRDLPYTPFSGNLSPALGLQLSIFPKHRFSVDIEANYLYAKSLRLVNYRGVSGPATDSVIISSHNFSFPLHITYRIVKGTFSPYVKVGARVGTEPYFSAVVKREYPGNRDLYNYSGFSSIGYDGCAGIEKFLSEKSALRLEYRYVQQNYKIRVAKFADLYSHQLLLNYLIIVGK